MLKAVTIALLVIFLFPACKNAGEGKENFPVKPANTAYLKDTPLPIDPDLLKDSPASVSDFYAANNRTTVWTNIADRKALIAAVKDAASDGLEPKDYNQNTLEQFESLTGISKEECARYDILLTESFSKLATHLFKGKLKPRTIYHDWALAPKKLDANKLLTEVLENHNTADVLARCRPKHAVYAGLRKSLEYLNGLPDDSGLTKIEIENPIKVNDSNAVAYVIKQRLAYWGDLAPENAKDGSYGKATARAVKKFQERHGMYANGIVDSRTAEVLNITRNQRKTQIIANLERWRWFPYDFGKRAIIINIPNFRLAVLENNNDTIETFKVVVGKPERRSPVLQSMFNHLMVNPTWTIPPTYMKEDLTPAAIKDTAHFSHLNIKIFRGENEVPVAEWDSLKPDHYVYVQTPGRHNSLGQVKFNFNNGFYVYLHDTNHREYFSKQYRALSSGCVRVQDPMKLAEYVLDDKETWTKEKLEELAALGETEKVPVKQGTYVHQLYWTAWMDKGGLQFRNDIYNLDKALYDKLRK